MQDEAQAPPAATDEPDDTVVTDSVRARLDEARVRRYILGRVAAFGRFAFVLPKKREPRHADTWRDKGPHESGGAVARRLRQMGRARHKATTEQFSITGR